MFPPVREQTATRLRFVFILLLALGSAGARSPRPLEPERPVDPGPEASGERCASARERVEEAERLRVEWTRDSLREAVERYADAISCWRAAGARAEVSGALLKTGDIHFALGEYAQARDDYAQALEGFKAGGDRRGQAGALYRLGLVYSYIGDTNKAARHSEAALALSRATGDKALEARALDALGFAHLMSSKTALALDGFKQALAAAREAGDRPQEAQVLLDIGYAYSDAGELLEALSSYEQALPLWQEAKDQRGLSRTLTAIGGAYSALGESQNALEHHRRALQIAAQMGDAGSQAAIQNGIGYAYEVLGDYGKALDAYRQALEDFGAAGNLPGEAQTAQFVGNIYWLQGDAAQAQDFYERGLALGRKLGDPTLEALALNGIGSAAQKAGQWPEARSSFERSLALYRKAGNRRGEAITLNNLGDLLRTQGDGRAALDYHARALPTARATGDRALEVLTLANIARLERDLGELGAARARLESTLKTVESLRAKVASQDLRASYFASVRRLYELYIGLLMELHGRQPSAGFDAAAFEASERARARSLLETLAAARVGLRQNADPELRERERTLRNELSEAAERRARLLASEHTEAELAAANKELDELTERYSEVDARIRAGADDEAARPQPLSLKEVQERVVDDDTVLLEFSLGEGRSYLWAVTKSAVASYELPGRAEIEDAAARVRKFLTEPQPVPGETVEARQARLKDAEEHYWPEAAALSRMLLGPAAASLKARRLLVVADGALQYIPFDALPEPGGDEAAPLMLGHEVTFQPSASALATLRGETAGRRRAEKAVAVFADPVFERDDSRIADASAGLASGFFKKPDAGAREGQGQPEVDRALDDSGVGAGGHIERLLSSREEAEAIMGVTPDGVGFKAVGFEANKATATGPSLGQYRIIHFATHGILDSEHPELSGLVLSLYDKYGQPQDGFLRLNDIYNMELPADMVVLSACNTGLGKDVKGEGLIGLTRGFMYAGVPRVVASLWKVDDEATAELMKRFYEKMLREKKSPAEALREAQVAMWRQKRWRAPYFWAAFVLQGEYEGTIEVGPEGRASANPALWAACAALALTLCGLYLTRRVSAAKKET